MKNPLKAAPQPKVAPQWQWHHRALLALRRVLTKEQEVRHAALHAPKEEGGVDYSDKATEEQEREELLAELSVEAAELSEIEAALVRLHNGTYGYCEVTGRPIAPERLKALPWTRFSRDIAAAREK